MNRVDEFFSMLLWAVERKDFEDFWPVGLESTGPRYWPQLVLDLERILMNTGEFKEPDYPTANVALVFCLIYGMRELNWNYEKVRIWLINCLSQPRNANMVTCLIQIIEMCYLTCKRFNICMRMEQSYYQKELLIQTFTNFQH